MKWLLVLTEFDLKYESMKVVEGQVLADLVAGGGGLTNYLKLVPWVLLLDGSMCH
jgi:hypothetical protein